LPLVSQRAYGRHRGCSHTAVQRAIQSGRIEKALREKNGRTLIDLEAADKLWAKNTQETLRRARPKPKGKTITQSVIPGTEEDVARLLEAEAKTNGREEVGAVARASIQSAQAKKLEAQASLTELQVERELGRTLPRDEVEREAARVARIIRDGLLALPDRLSGLLAAETEETLIRDLLREETTKLLEELVANVKA